MKIYKVYIRFDSVNWLISLFVIQELLMFFDKSLILYLRVQGNIY